MLQDWDWPLRWKTRIPEPWDIKLRGRNLVRNAPWVILIDSTQFSAAGAYAMVFSGLPMECCVHVHGKWMSTKGRLAVNGATWCHAGWIALATDELVHFIWYRDPTHAVTGWLCSAARWWTIRSLSANGLQLLTRRALEYMSKLCRSESLAYMRRSRRRQERLFLVTPCYRRAFYLERKNWRNKYYLPALVNVHTSRLWTIRH